jgi:hypothetical protein
MGGFPKEEKDDPEELGGPQTRSSEDPSFSLEQGKPWCI